MKDSAEPSLPKGQTTPPASRIPWARIAVEGIAILVSILMALAIDEWWDGVQDRAEERELLTALRIEFGANQERITFTLEAHREHQARFDWFQSAAASELLALPNDSARAYWRALDAPLTLEPGTGTLRSILSSGKLDLIRDSALRSLLSEWLAALDNHQEASGSLLAAALRVRQAAESHGGPFQRFPDRRREPLREVDGSILVGLQRDDSFMGTARFKQSATINYVQQLETLLAMLEDLSELVGPA